MPLAWHGNTRHGMAWHGHARHGMAWHGMAWPYMTAWPYMAWPYMAWQYMTVGVSLASKFHQQWSLWFVIQSICSEASIRESMYQ